MNNYFLLLEDSPIDSKTIATQHCCIGVDGFFCAKCCAGSRLIFEANFVSHDADDATLSNAAPGQTQHQRVELWATQRDLRLTSRVWPDKVALVQSPGGQPEADAIVHQHFHAVGPCVGKQVGCVGMGSAEDFDYACQARVNARAHVQGFCGEPHGINADHASTSRSHWAH